jgi:hypothetical protein
MSVIRKVRAAVLLALVGAWGCASPRFVSIGPEGGTIAMPSNSSYYRSEAMKMLNEKYPNGWVIDHEGEVVVGQLLTKHMNDQPVAFGNRIEQRTEVHDRTEWHIDFHPKGVEPTRQTVVAPPPVVQPVIQQASYVQPLPPPPVVQQPVRVLPKEPVPILGSDGQAPR